LASPDLRFGWRPYRPELPVVVQTDINLGAREALVQQVVQFPGPGRPPKRVILRLPEAARADAPLREALSNSFRVLSEGRLEPLEEGDLAGSWAVPNTEKGQPLTVRYTFPLPPAGLVQVPLLWPEQATRTEAKVRVWSEPDGPGQWRAALAGRGWK